MPVKEILKGELSKEKEILKGRLVDEMRSPHEQGTSPFVQYPLIILEKSKPLERIHLTVIWDDEDWKNLEISARCSLALRAFSEVYPGEAVKVSSSLGTTTQEAGDEFGIDLERVLQT